MTFNKSTEIDRPPDAQSTIHQGPLKKKSPKMIAFNSWQDRWVRLTKDGLFYYRKENAPQYQGAIPLHCIENIVCDPGLFKKKGFRIDIHLQPQYNRVFSFTAKTENEIMEWYRKLQESHRQAMVIAATTRPADGAQGATATTKVWKIDKKENNKKDNKDDDNNSKLQIARQGRNNVDTLVKRQFDGYLAQSQPVYQPFQQVPPQLNIFENLETLAQTLLGDYRIESEEQNRELGSVYIIGNQHYPMTHQSYLLHCIYRSEPWLVNAVQSMDLVARCQEFPLFPTLIHCGETSDAIYSIYHPPLRSSEDSLFSWLAKCDKFPEHIVAWTASHILLALDYLHQQNVSFTSLSPETIFIDGSGTIRICELFLNPNPTLLTSIPEYTSPELLEYEILGASQDQEPPHHFNADYWRLGVLLFELATGLPPFRPRDDHPTDGPTITPDMLLTYKKDIYSQIMQFRERPETLMFPPTVSPPLKDLILTLLSDQANRPLNQQPIRSHPFFQDQQNEINREYQTTKNIYTLQFFDSLKQQRYMIEQQIAQGQQPDIPMLPTELSLWDLNSLISFPKPDWVQENILSTLYVKQRDITPANLSFIPRPVVVQRISANVMHCRALPRETSQRIVCNVTIGTDTQKTEMGSQVSHDLVEFSGEPLTFDILDEQYSHPAAEVMVEVTTLVSSDQNKKQIGISTSKPQFVGLVTFPLQQLRQHGFIQSWLTMFDYNGLPVGELELSLGLEVEEIQLNPQVLSRLTDNTMHFPQRFGKPLPTGGRKLHSLLLDPSVLAQSERQSQQDILGVSQVDAPNRPVLTNQQVLATPGFAAQTPLPQNNLSANASNSWLSPALSPSASIPGRMSSATIVLPPPVQNSHSSNGGYPASPHTGSLNSSQSSYHASIGAGRASRADALISASFRQNATTQGTPLGAAPVFEPLPSLTVQEDYEQGDDEDPDAPPVPPLPPSTTFLNVQSPADQTLGKNNFMLGIETIAGDDEEEEEEEESGFQAFTMKKNNNNNNGYLSPPPAVPVPPPVPPSPVNDVPPPVPAPPPPVPPSPSNDMPPPVPAPPVPMSTSTTSSQGVCIPGLPPAPPPGPTASYSDNNNRNIRSGNVPLTLMVGGNSNADNDCPPVPPPVPPTPSKAMPPPLPPPTPKSNPMISPMPPPTPKSNPMISPMPPPLPPPTPKSTGLSPPAPPVSASLPEDALPPPPPPAPEPEPDPNTILKNWRTAKASDGKKYYFNKVTKLVSWEPPTCLSDYAPP